MRKWLPYAPAGMPGVWFKAFQMIPTRSGSYYPNNLFTEHGNAAALTSPGTTLRAWCALRTNDSVLAFMGTTTKLWLYDGVTTFTDLSKVGGYTSTATDWSFAQYGEITIAANRVDALQSRDGAAGGAFGDCAGSPPKARIVVAQADQILLFDLNDGAEKADAFAACAPGDYTDWSGAGATTATRIRHRPGPIKAACAFRDYVLVAKRSSVYKLTYTGSNTYKWRVELIAIGRGAWGKHDLVNCGDSVIMSGPGGAWKYDGASWTPITDYVGEIPESKASLFSPLSQNVHFFLAGGLGATVPEQYTYNLVSDRWGTGKYRFIAAGGGAGIGSGYRPMTGEPAALASFVAPTVALPDLVFMLDGAATTEVLKNSQYWGNGTVGAAQLAAAVISGFVEGLGGNTITQFGRLTPEFTMSLRDLASDPTPGATELLLNIITSDAPDKLSANGSVTYASNGLASSTTQRRFDFNHAAPYARFEIVLPLDSGYVEITDYKLTSPGGEVLKAAGSL